VAVEAQDLRRAIGALQEVSAAGETVEASVFNSLIQLCGTSGQIDYALQIFEYMHKVQVLPNSATFKTLISACITHGELGRAESAMRDMTSAGWEPESALVEALLCAHVASRPAAPSLLQLCERLQRSVIMGQQRLVPTLLECCVKMGEYAVAADVFTHALAAGHYISIDFLSQLVHMASQSQRANANANANGVSPDPPSALLALIQEHIVESKAGAQ